MNAVQNSKSQRSRPKPSRKSGVIVPHQTNRLQRLGAWLVFLALRSVMLTIRYRWNDPAGVVLKPLDQPRIFATWHNRLALCMECYRVYSRSRKDPGMAALVSASKDGGFLADILKCFKVQPVRGSSSRRGPQALLELVSWAERGYDLAITPDGPRGPCYVVQEGVMVLAQLTAFPIIPFSYNLAWKIQLKSWDRFQIPIPFSKCEMNVGIPIYVPRDASEEQREELRRQVEKAMKDLTRD
jgi:lysophospholipid acyltransferase (LPLAT)-like uncharacterized protein